MRSLPILVLLFMTLALPALAGDGVLEINQACAIQTGCFAGDTAGYPVTIGTMGSYRLTSNLSRSSFGAQNENFIEVQADYVSIDLAGFSISCSGILGASCTGTGSGIEALAASAISVRNGSIHGMGGHGVLIGGQSEVTNVRVRSNRLDGINALWGSTISGNTIHQNRGSGIIAGNGSIVSGNTVVQNGDAGIQAGNGSTVSGNTIFANDGDGIQTAGGVTVWGNTVRANTGFGLNLSVWSGYRENVISNNTGGTVDEESAVNLGNNACNGSTTCP